MEQTIKADGTAMISAGGANVGALLCTRNLAIAVVLIGLIYRSVVFLGGYPIWGDEASVAASVFSRDYAGMLRQPLEYHQIAPVGFLWAQLAVTHALGLNEWSLRLVAFASGTLAFGLFALFARRIVGGGAALLAVAVMAASYYPVRHTAELKPYAGDMLASLAVMMLAWRIHTSPRSVWAWVCLGVVASAAVWFSLPAVLAVSGVMAFLAWSAATKRSAGMLLGLAAAGVVFAASFMAAYLTFIAPMGAASPHYYSDSSQWAAAFPPWDRPWLVPVWLVEVHTGNMLAYPLGGKHFGSTGTTILVAVGCISLWRSRRRDAVFLLLAPIAVALAAACVKKYPYGASARTTLFMASSFCALAGVGLYAILRYVGSPARAESRVRIAAVVLASIAVAGIVVSIVRPYKDYRPLQVRQFIRQIAAETSSGDQWVVPNAIADGQAGPPLGGQQDNVFRYYVTALAPAGVLWGPAPQDVPAVKGKLFLLCLSDPLLDGRHPERAAWQNGFVDAMTRRIGPPSRMSLSVNTEPAKTNITAYRFDAASPHGPGNSPDAKDKP